MQDELMRKLDLQLMMTKVIAALIGLILAVIVIEGNVVKNQLIRSESSMSNEDILKLNILLNSFL